MPLGNILPLPKEAVETRIDTNKKPFLQFCLLLIWSPSIFHECFCHGSHSRYQRLWDISFHSVCLDTAASPGHLTICSAGSRVQTMSLSLCLSTIVLLPQLALPSVDATYAGRYPARSSMNTRRDYSPVVLRKVQIYICQKKSWVRWMQQRTLCCPAPILYQQMLPCLISILTTHNNFQDVPSSLNL